MDSLHGPILHQWTFAEFEHHRHSPLWWIGATVFLIVSIGLAIWYKNYTFAFFLFALGVVLLVRESQGPEQMRVRIREGAMELLFDAHHQEGREPTTVIPWNQIRHFWIVYKPPEVRNLYFHFDSPVKPRLKIPIMDENPVQIRETLRTVLEEDIDNIDEPITDALGRFLKI
ncbi:hypothetical protein HZA86_03290 [Candidatus Uhrbacteria bacterium]|nr:hypothetical protein [Candidatus Uhrbacteria bacterium]